MERHRVGVEARVQMRGQPAQGAEVARHDQQPPARTQDRIEGAQHARGAEVVGVDERAYQLRPGRRRCQPRGVENLAADLRPRVGDPGGRGADAIRVAAGEVDDVLGRELAWRYFASYARQPLFPGRA
jgi:hypothetical protein